MKCIFWVFEALLGGGALRHGLLLSDGAWTESYRDDANRHLFGQPGLTVLWAGASPGGGGNPGTCLPLVLGGVELDRIRATLSRGAEALAKAG